MSYQNVDVEVVEQILDHKITYELTYKKKIIILEQ